MYNNSVSTITYQIIRTKKLTANVSLKVKNGQVFVHAPFWVTKGFLEKFVADKEAWIIKVLKSFKPAEPDKKYEEGEDHLLFGESLKLEIILADNPTRTSVLKAEDKLSIQVYAQFDKLKRSQELKNALLMFYLEKGIEYLTEKVNFYTNLLGVDYTKVEIKKVSSIWGSCSAKNVLSFNRKLVMAPYEVIDYVVIHEVCHLKERNHSSRFWSLVFKLDKDYKQHRRWLHQNHQLLTL